ncbi:MAG TPA: hypothetical protein VHW09_18625 [Bryobacteraceae bacterium]|jgi:hypothetical protein|nr:hypothetical protein [Bryobacteraceae bacterium]
MKPLAIASVTLLLGLAACSSSQTALPPDASADGGAGNLVPVADTAPTTAQTTDAAYVPAAAPVEQTYGEPVVESPQPPPPLPQYSQPPCPGDDYAWTPGYWDYSDSGYYWVPGAWVLAPYVGALWTPPWWGYANGEYLWHAGYWGPHIGFYGGIDYGFGYTGRGYYGASWRNGALYYNRSVTNINSRAVHNVYDYRVSSTGHGRVSYNGGRGGIAVQPTAQEMAARRDPHRAPVAAQVDHARSAAADRSQFAAGRAAPSHLVAAQSLHTDYRAPAGRTAPAPAARTPETARPAGHGAERTPEAARPGARPLPAERPNTESARGPAEPARGPQAAPPQQQANRQQRAPEQHAAPTQQANRAQRPTEQHAAPPQQVNRAQRPPEQHAAPPQQANRAQRPPEQHAAPQQQRARQMQQANREKRAPEQHAAPPQQHAPQAHPPEQHAAPQQHAPEQHANPRPPEKKKGG